jgi:hypothetical protein
MMMAYPPLLRRVVNDSRVERFDPFRLLIDSLVEIVARCLHCRFPFAGVAGVRWRGKL